MGKRDEAKPESHEITRQLATLVTRGHGPKMAMRSCSGRKKGLGSTTAAGLTNVLDIFSLAFQTL